MKTKSIKGKPGIRIKENRKFIVFKLLAEKRTCKEFFSLCEAKDWKNDRNSFDLKVNGKSPVTDENGITLEDVYAQYLEEGMVELTEYTIYKKKLRMSHFLPNLFMIKMPGMNARVILKHLQDIQLLVNDESKRYNFDKELKRSFFHF